MTALSPDLTARIAKMLPMLSSTAPGDVVNCAAAVTRTLKAAGCDWHDLAGHVAEGPREVIRYIHKPQDPSQAGPRSYGDWRQTYREVDPRRRHKAQVARVRTAPPGFLSAWEAEFCGSLARQLEGTRNLSPRQTTILADIFTRFEERYG